MASKFADLKRQLQEEEMRKQLGGAPEQGVPAPQQVPVDVNMLQQQLAPQIDENALAMAQAPQVAADDSFFSGMSGGFGANPSADEQKKELEFINRQKARQNIKEKFAPRDPSQDPAWFNKIRKALGEDI